MKTIDVFTLGRTNFAFTGKIQKSQIFFFNFTIQGL